MDILFTAPDARPSPIKHRRHDYCLKKPTFTQPLQPQSLSVSFPSSRRKDRHCPPSPATYKPFPTRETSPAHQQNHQDRLQTALSHLARAAAHLHLLPSSNPAGTYLSEALFRFAAPSWSAETWDVAVKEHVARAGRDGDEMGSSGKARDGTIDAAAELVALAVGVLKKGGEEGMYWRDGRDLGEMWERAVGEVGGPGLRRW